MVELQPRVMSGLEQISGFEVLIHTAITQECYRLAW